MLKKLVIFSITVFLLFLMGWGYVSEKKSPAVNTQDATTHSNPCGKSESLNSLKKRRIALTEEPVINLSLQIDNNIVLENRVELLNGIPTTESMPADKNADYVLMVGDGNNNENMGSIIWLYNIPAEQKNVNVKIPLESHMKAIQICYKDQQIYYKDILDIK